MASGELPHLKDQEPFHISYNIHNLIDITKYANTMFGPRKGLR